MNYDNFLEVINSLKQKRVILIGMPGVMHICCEVLRYFNCMDISICDNSSQKQGLHLLTTQL